jgi:hypothetical protein
MEYSQKAVKDLIPYINNARTHSDEQVTQIASSIREFGFINPIIIDDKNNVIAGHGRLLASKKLGLKEVPTVLVDHLTDTQRKAYVLADNQLALNAGWDDSFLKIELSDLLGDDFNLKLIGFSDSELDKLLKLTMSDQEKEELYTTKIEVPIYIPSEKCPELKELFDSKKTLRFIKIINESGLNTELKDFLILACYRFTVFNFDKIADFYAHQKSLELKDIFEQLALIIPDYDRAIELGFVKLSKKLHQQAEAEYGY